MCVYAEIWARAVTLLCSYLIQAFNKSTAFLSHLFFKKNNKIEQGLT